VRWIRRPPSIGLPATSCDNLRTPTWPNVGDCKGRAGLSLLAAYPSIVGHEMYSPVPIYPGTMPAYRETTQIPPGPRPYGSTGKRLGRTRKHDEPPPQHKSKPNHEHGMNDEAWSQV
jgi:hypothetical protein